ncbi:group II intron maturase-specific domain-containing protein [Streptomyces sp. NPDC002055]|uniref:group II intron maturase-specific domain-containing protein n=1 Tax=Streptomyces sp. NPDC002055 TaxID=3154534 RepID=UPI00331A8FF7
MDQTNDPAAARRVSCPDEQSIAAEIPRDVLIRLYRIMRGWANHFKHTVCKAALSSLASFTRHRVISCWMALHRWKWKDARRRLTDHNGRWRMPSADGIELFDLQKVTVARTATEATRCPTPGPVSTTAERQSPRRVWYSKTDTPGSASGMDGATATPAPRSVPTQRAPGHPQGRQRPLRSDDRTVARSHSNPEPPIAPFAGKARRSGH